MFNALLSAVRGMLGSKKFLAAVATILGARLCHKIGCDPSAARDVLIAGASYIGAQGLADFGREAAKHRAPPQG